MAQGENPAFPPASRQGWQDSVPQGASLPGPVWRCRQPCPQTHRAACTSLAFASNTLVKRITTIHLVLYRQALCTHRPQGLLPSGWCRHAQSSLRFLRSRMRDFLCPDLRALGLPDPQSEPTIAKFKKNMWGNWKKWWPVPKARTVSYSLGKLCSSDFNLTWSRHLPAVSWSKRKSKRASVLLHSGEIPTRTQLDRRAQSIRGPLGHTGAGLLPASAWQEQKPVRLPLLLPLPASVSAL